MKTLDPDAMKILIMTCIMEEEELTDIIDNQVKTRKMKWSHIY